jgi:chromosome partitioning protein
MLYSILLSVIKKVHKMILLIGGEKGGTGKSTIATNIAVKLAHQQQEVVIIDCDPQCTATKWVSRRNKLFANLPKVFCIQKTGDIYDTTIDMSNRYKYVIIDAGGRDSEELRTAMVACHKMYIPLKASQPDIETSHHIIQLVKLAKTLNPKLLAFTMISMAPTNHVLKEDQEAILLLSKLNIAKVSNIIIRERKVYRDAIADGKGVIEYDNIKATNEIKQLSEEIFFNE